MQIPLTNNNMKRFMYMVEQLYKIFNVIERGDVIEIKGHYYKFRVLDIYDNGQADVFPIDPYNPKVFEGRMRASLKDATLHKKQFHTHLRDSKHDNGWRQIGGVFFNIYSLDQKRIPLKEVMPLHAPVARDKSIKIPPREKPVTHPALKGMTAKDLEDECK